MLLTRCLFRPTVLYDWVSAVGSDRLHHARTHLLPLAHRQGHPPPTGGLRFPLWLVFWVAWLLELLFRAVGRHWDFSRYFLLTRAEVYKAGCAA